MNLCEIIFCMKYSTLLNSMEKTKGGDKGHRHSNQQGTFEIIVLCSFIDSNISRVSFRVRGSSKCCESTTSASAGGLDKFRKAGAVPGASRISPA